VLQLIGSHAYRYDITSFVVGQIVVPVILCARTATLEQQPYEEGSMLENTPKHGSMAELIELQCHVHDIMLL